MMGAGLTTLIASLLLGAPWWLTPAVAWFAVSATYNVWTWSSIARYSPDQTRTHALAEDGGRRFRDSLILVANVGGLAAVAALIFGGHKLVADGVGIASALCAMACVASSWVLLHTVFLLRYAQQYYADTDGAGTGDSPAAGIDFNQAAPPDYLDFAYFTFSIGMTYQVSDNAITGHHIRVTALIHSLMSFVFGTVVLATAVNLVLSLL